MKFSKILKFAVVILMMFSATNILAQNCRTFAKKQCIKELAPYIHDGQYHVTTLSPGESAQMYMTFYSGQDYMVRACADEEVLGEDVILKIRDANRNVIFDNTKNDNVKFWTFSVKSSQQLIIEIIIPKESETNETVSGCVSILVGFMNEEGNLSK